MAGTIIETKALTKRYGALTAVERGKTTAV